MNVETNCTKISIVWDWNSDSLKLELIKFDEFLFKIRPISDSPNKLDHQSKTVNDINLYH